MTAVEFQAVAHHVVLDSLPEHRRRLDGKTLRVVLMDAETRGTEVTWRFVGLPPRWADFTAMATGA